MSLAEGTAFSRGLGRTTLPRALRKSTLLGRLALPRALAEGFFMRRLLFEISSSPQNFDERSDYTATAAFRFLQQHARRPALANSNPGKPAALSWVYDEIGCHGQR